ncbi:MAG: tetratricopeptide repeat protein [Candidatus Sericytochromatia bacterium]
MMGYYKKTIDLIENKKETLNSIELFILANAYKNLNEKNKCLFYLEKSLEKNIFPLKFGLIEKNSNKKEEFINEFYYYTNLEIGRIYLEKNEYDKALKFIDKCISLNKKNKEAYLIKSQIFLLDKKYNEVINNIKSLKEVENQLYSNDLFIKTAENFLNKSNNTKDLEELISFFLEESNLKNKNYIFFCKKMSEELLLNNPDNQNALLFLAYSEQLDNNNNQAIQYYEKLIKINKKSFEAFYNISFIYLEENNINKAINHMKEFVNIFPKSPYGYFCLASFYYLINDKENSKKYYDITNKLSKNTSLIKKGLELIKFDNNKELLKLYLFSILNNDQIFNKITKNLLSKEKTNKINYELAYFYNVTNNLDKAEFFYEKYLLNEKELSNKNKNTSIYLEIADLYKRFSQFRDSETYLIKALKLDSKNYNITSLIGDNYINQNKYKESIPYYLKSIELGSKNESDFINLGFAYLENKDALNCIKFSEKALNIKKNATAYNNIGFCYEMNKNDKRAEKFYNEALKLDPNFSKAYSNLINLYMRTGQTEKLIKDKK